MKLKKKILILTSNPKATPPLRLDKEVREIDEGLRRSKYRDQFEINSVWAVRFRDLRRALLDHEPEIVHFIGHGSKEGLLVEDEMGMAVRVSAKALSNLFELFSDKIECVILSACYSAPQANAISKHIDYVIGMRKEVGDEAKQEIMDFLTQTIKAGNRYDLHIQLHISLAFFVGRVLNPKCGAEINIYQSSPRRELWILSQKFEMKNAKIWKVEDYEIQNIDGELAAAVSVTQNTLADVEAYAKNHLSNISHLIHLKLDKIHPGSIKDASHAYQASYEASEILREKYRQIGASRLHLFLAAPNVFTFMLALQIINELKKYSVHL